ncbi:MAG TPA: fluoride efflux transporter CrcB [Candidatus Gastranaerophilales bacterium]|nr:fluoride efflux transporter CrcB [Candidatus Gastranaerophilales bacterium]
MRTFFLIALGGAIGALLRFIVTELTTKLTGIAFPWGTILVNLAGCFVIGLLWGIFNDFEPGNNARLFVFTGILGAFTTFSSFALENFNLFRSGDIQLLTFNIAINNILGIALVFAGFYLSSFLFIKR